MLDYVNMLDELQKTQNALKRSVRCTIFFNQNEEIVDANNKATEFLKRNKVEYSIGNKFMNLNEKQFQYIVTQLQKGQHIHNIQFEFTRLDNSSVSVVLQAALLLGLKDLYVFQFTEMNTSQRIISPIR